MTRMMSFALPFFCCAILRASPISDEFDALVKMPETGILIQSREGERRERIENRNQLAVFLSGIPNVSVRRLQVPVDTAAISITGGSVVLDNEEIQYLASLRELRYIRISSVILSIGDLSPLGGLAELRQLKLSGLRGELPRGIGALRRVPSILLPENQLRRLAADFSDLQDLEELDLGGNALTVVPPELQGLGSLRWLDVSRNRIANGLSNVPRSVEVLIAGANPVTEVGTLLEGNRKLQLLELQSTGLTNVDVSEKWTVFPTLVLDDDVAVCGPVVVMMRIKVTNRMP